MRGLPGGLPCGSEWGERDQGDQNSEGGDEESDTVVIAYHLQKNKSNYDDLGGNYFDRIHSDGLKRYLVKRLQQLGHMVTLEPMEAA